MDIPLGFGSNTERRVLPDPQYAVGPGTYSPPTAFRRALPNYVGFSTTSKRSSLVRGEDLPAPGQYHKDHTKELLHDTLTSTAFKSKSKRFEEINSKTEGPGPGTYEIRENILKPKKKDAKSSLSHSAPMALLCASIAPAVQQVPSIPTKFQSYGYEDAQDGRLVPQPSTRPGFTGIKNDTVGPGDYDPNFDVVKFKKVPHSDFTKGHERYLLLEDQQHNTPGPGAYDTPSAFSMHNEQDIQPGQRISFKEYTSRNRQMSVFQSNTTRAFPSSLSLSTPGPAHYNIPGSVVVKTRPPSKQCFDSTVDRFVDPTPSSLRLNTYPGEYDVISSDFDQSRLKILKHKRMTARSSWAQNVAFSGTEARFGSADNHIPAPGEYHPKTSLADKLPKPNPRAGAFGSKSKRRFFADKPSQLPREPACDPNLRI
eukprot:CAMPEP_0182423352 /NCGR_PEP_ID=MMETSP1167-20130531/9320_1 /TAXON_ID=2988 /ORGANISM="Mallomonas Sp, Strain CCMP3275" /LENGTH=425 /DNA_ID=CAMNT_0024602243 /DNA_START=8 /DNA_END=1285 /DNA_ORIENTATION=+